MNGIHIHVEFRLRTAFTEMVIRNTEVLRRRVWFCCFYRLYNDIERQMVFLCRILSNSLDGVIRFLLRKTLHQPRKAFTALGTGDWVGKRCVTQTDIEHADILDYKRLSVLQIDRITNRIREVVTLPGVLHCIGVGKCLHFTINYCADGGLIQNIIHIDVTLRVHDAFCRLIAFRFVKYNTVNPFGSFFPGLKGIRSTAFFVEDQITAVAVDIVIGKTGCFKGFRDLLHAFGAKFIHCGHSFLHGCNPAICVCAAELCFFNIPPDFQKCDVVLFEKLHRVVADR